MPHICWSSKQGQGRKGSEEGRNRTRIFLHHGAATPCAAFPSAMSLLPATLNPLSLFLQAKESIEQLVYLCQTDKEPVREAAKQSLMLCGECPAAPPCSLPTRYPKWNLLVPAEPVGDGGLGLVAAYPTHPGSSCPKFCQATARWQWAVRAKLLRPWSTKPGCHLLFARWH